MWKAAVAAPLEGENLHPVAGAIDDHRARLGVTDWGITETTLEEVFLHLVKNPVATFGVGDLKGGTAKAAAVVPR